MIGLVGGTADVEARLREYGDAGADTVVLVPSATDDDPAGDRTLRSLAGEVSPAGEVTPDQRKPGAGREPKTLHAQ